MTPARPASRKSVEAEGATIKEAIAKALRQLGVRRDQAVVRVLAEGEKGLFGMRGAAYAKVRVTLKP